MGSTAGRSFQALLAEVAARSPAPGGGSASAWAGALGAALTEMVARFADAGQVAERAGALRAELLKQAERDLTSYEPVLEAQRLPVDDLERGRRIEDALAKASEAPLAIARVGTEVVELAAGLAAEAPSSLKGDAIAGALLAESASQAAAQLVKINLARDGSDARLGEVAELMRRAASARQAAIASAGRA